ncbi:MAG: LysM peptidoglycan-binding domain-containing protein [Phycisphaerales bacterium]|nr:MAG: LysM peptidoglycan-binding domain-containing protein [Phycisphaerales bacterium]
MYKDLKIGLIVGLAIVSVVGLWLATRPSLTPQGRLPDTSNLVRRAKEETRGTRDSRQNNRPSSIVAPPSSAARSPIRRDVAEEPIERHTPAAPAVNVQPEKIRPQRFHIVRQGETLSEISYDYYGSAGKWRKIFEANRDTVKSADVVKAGTKLIIPD